MQSADINSEKPKEMSTTVDTFWKKSAAVEFWNNITKPLTARCDNRSYTFGKLLQKTVNKTDKIYREAHV